MTLAVNNVRCGVLGEIVGAKDWGYCDLIGPHLNRHFWNPEILVMFQGGVGLFLGRVYWSICHGKEFLYCCTASCYCI